MSLHEHLPTPHKFNLSKLTAQPTSKVVPALTAISRLKASKVSTPIVKPSHIPLRPALASRPSLCESLAAPGRLQFGCSKNSKRGRPREGRCANSLFELSILFLLEEHHSKQCILVGQQSKDAFWFAFLLLERLTCSSVRHWRRTQYTHVRGQGAHPGTAPPFLWHSVSLIGEGSSFAWSGAAADAHSQSSALIAADCSQQV